MFYGTVSIAWWINNAPGQGAHIETVKFEGYIEIDYDRQIVQLYDSSDETTMIIPLRWVQFIERKMTDGEKFRIQKREGERKLEKD